MEFCASLLRRDRRCPLNDAISSLGIGIFGTTTGLYANVLGLWVYRFFGEGHRLWSPMRDSAAVFFWAVVFCDFFFYWSHRLHHRINLLWAAHSTHHSSEGLNLSTALRQSALMALTGWITFIPMAILGFSIESYLFGAAFLVLYGFFTHTQYIPELGWYERIFIGASSHRVHHGKNPIYIDKNYGCIFLLWDRVFGTYQREVAGLPIEYGVLHPVRTLNPILASLLPYSQLFDKVRGVNGLDRLKALLGPPEWQPHVPKGTPSPGVEPSKPFDPLVAPAKLLYCCFQFTAAAIGAALIMTAPTTVSRIAVFAASVVLWTALDSIGRILDAKASALRLELLRELSLAAVLTLGFAWNGGFTHPVGTGLLAYVISSLLCLGAVSAYERGVKVPA